MPFLNIDGIDYEAKVNYAFNRLAKEKYFGEDKEGNKSSGLTNIYEKLLRFDHEGLIGFWDCALNSVKNRPKLFKIEEALEERIEQDGESEQLFKDCFNAMDQSGFFKTQAKKFWKDMEKTEDFVTDEKEKEQVRAYIKQMQESREAMTA